MGPASLEAEGLSKQEKRANAQRSVIHSGAAFGSDGANQREGRATGGATEVPDPFEEPLEDEDEEEGCVFATTRGLAASRPCCCCCELCVDDAMLVWALGGGVWRWRAARGAEELEPPLDAPDPVCTTHAEVERTANENAIRPSCFIVPSYEPKFGGGVSPEFSKTARCSLDIRAPALA